jgi:hypothetical protein
MLDVPYRGGYVTFYDVLLASANLHAGVPVPKCVTTVKAAHRANEKAASVSKQLGKPVHNALTALSVAGGNGLNNGLDLTRKQWADLIGLSVEEVANMLPIDELCGVENERRRAGLVA